MGIKNKILFILIILVGLLLLLPTGNEVNGIENPMGLHSDKVNYARFVATAYVPELGGINADNNPEVTSIGMDSQKGIIAVNPDLIPYGSEMIVITDDKVIRGVAGDTGGFVNHNPWQIDILLEDEDKAFEFGKQIAHVIWWEEENKQGDKNELESGKE